MGLQMMDGFFNPFVVVHVLKYRGWGRKKPPGSCGGLRQALIDLPGGEVGFDGHDGGFQGRAADDGDAFDPVLVDRDAPSEGDLGFRVAVQLENLHLSPPGDLAVFHQAQGLGVEVADLAQGLPLDGILDLFPLLSAVQFLSYLNLRIKLRGAPSRSTRWITLPSSPGSGLKPARVMMIA